ncbi:ABC transporter permease [Bariatricus sp. SGI.154]|uniref:ABC transporter permease n=1 Tax=Bariatricus sp. SGI.154 TaxID=3420549 RepID=UPI003D01B672
MKQFMTVLRFELNNYFKNKSFVITTAVLAVLLAAVIIVPTLIPGLLGDDSSGEDAKENMEKMGICVQTEEIRDMNSLLTVFPAKWTEFADEKELKQAVETEEIEAGFVLKDGYQVTYVVNNLSISDTLSEQFGMALNQYRKQQYLVELGLSPEEAANLENAAVTVVPEILGKNSARNYGYTYILIFVVYFLILFYGQMIATSVTTEKSNRAIEILVTSVNSNSLIFGKVLAGAIAGIIQAAVILGSGFLSYHTFGEKWGGLLDFLFEIPVRVLVTYIFFALMSYLLYAFIFGMLGAMVSKTEDISKSSTPITMIYVASFLVAIFGMSDSDGMLIKVASFIPFTSGNAMFIRVSMGSVAVWEILLSGGLLLLSCVVAGILAAKIFRFGTLHYGNPIKFKTALKNVRGK